MCTAGTKPQDTGHGTQGACTAGVPVKAGTKPVYKDALSVVGLCWSPHPSQMTLRASGLVLVSSRSFLQ